VLNCVDTKYLPKFHMGLQKKFVYFQTKNTQCSLKCMYNKPSMCTETWCFFGKKFPFDSSELEK